MAVDRLVRSQSDGNQAPESVALLHFKTQVMPDASLGTLKSMDYAAFCNTPISSFPVRGRVFTCYHCILRFAPLLSRFFLPCRSFTLLFKIPVNRLIPQAFVALNSNVTTRKMLQ